MTEATPDDGDGKGDGERGPFGISLFKEHDRFMMESIRGARSRSSTVTILAGVGVSVVPLLVLVLPAALGLPAVEPLLHESQFFPGFSRASLVAIPLAGLVIINLAIFVANRSMRSALVASLITSVLALFLVLGAVGLVNSLNEMLVGLD